MLKKFEEPFFTPNKDLPDLLPRTVDQAELYLIFIRDLFNRNEDKTSIKRGPDGKVPFLPNPEFPEEMIPRLHEFGFRLPKGFKR